MRISSSHARLCSTSNTWVWAAVNAPRTWSGSVNEELIYVSPVIGGYWVSQRYLLKSAANRRYTLGVEAEPVHPSHVARVLDLDASVHDDREAARFRDARAFLIDHSELAPHVLRADRHGLLSDARHGRGRAEDVDDVHGNRHVGEA